MYLPKREYIVTGNPVRTAVLDVDRAKARKALSIDNRPMILSFGGSLGAMAVNRAVAELMGRHARKSAVLSLPRHRQRLLGQLYKRHRIERR